MINVSQMGGTKTGKGRVRFEGEGWGLRTLGSRVFIEERAGPCWT